MQRKNFAWVKDDTNKLVKIEKWGFNIIKQLIDWGLWNAFLTVWSFESRTWTTSNGVEFPKTRDDLPVKLSRRKLKYHIWDEIRYLIIGILVENWNDEK